jgi:hypothetical protein
MHLDRQAITNPATWPTNRLDTNFHQQQRLARAQQTSRAQKKEEAKQDAKAGKKKQRD